MTNVADMHRRKRSMQMEDALLFGVFGLLMFGPLAFGAVERWSIFVIEAGSVLLFLAWIAKQVVDREMRIRWNPLFFPMGIFGALVGCQLIFRVTAYPHETITLALLYA
ncbi:MAG: hypothetical protein WCC95_22505, partial [Candidatus Sulfotelmatobacter sp.]